MEALLIITILLITIGALIIMIFIGLFEDHPELECNVAIFAIILLITTLVLTIRLEEYLI